MRELSFWQALFRGQIYKIRFGDVNNSSFQILNSYSRDSELGLVQLLYTILCFYDKGKSVH